MGENTTEVNKLDQPFPMWFMLLIPIYLMLVLSIFVFPFAGDWRWTLGWIFVISLAINIFICYMIINKKNPRVLRNRSKLKKIGLTAETRQAASSDRFIFPLMAIGFFGEMILPALGHRFGWFTLTFPIAIFGVIIMNVGVSIINIATLQISYASKIRTSTKARCWWILGCIHMCVTLYMPVRLSWEFLSPLHWVPYGG